ncbi:MAG: M20/M25/M40 family metallo-hydrolase [Chloroflexi bacterium]|nr:M20/M25/M40 family metallo-hydrolase [Chloroflexota bacterium]
MTTPQIQNLLSNITADPAASPEAIFARLSRLLDAPAPANSCALPGAVGEVIMALADELGLRCAPFGSTGNLTLELGDPGAPLDLLVTAHMDRPCFRVRRLADGTLYPLCAIRVPGDGYVCEAAALRYIDGRVRVAAVGNMRFEAVGGSYRIRFQAESGALRAGDTVMMRAAPQLRDGLAVGAGLDNAIGVLLALLTAHSLQQYAAEAIADRRILFAFTDQEEGPPIGLFGQGAARLAHSIEQPRLGFINIDGHNVDEEAGHVLGVGASQAFVSGDGRGSVVPLDYQALAESLAAQVNETGPGTVRLNYSYVSRSDDMLLSAWARCLGLTGVIVANAHTTEETVALDDVVAAAHWIPSLIQELLEG